MLLLDIQGLRAGPKPSLQLYHVSFHFTLHCPPNPKALHLCTGPAPGQGGRYLPLCVAWPVLGLLPPTLAQPLSLAKSSSTCKFLPNGTVL